MLSLWFQTSQQDIFSLCNSHPFGSRSVPHSQSIACEKCFLEFATLKSLLYLDSMHVSDYEAAKFCKERCTSGKTSETRKLTLFWKKVTASAMLAFKKFFHAPDTEGADLLFKGMDSDCTPIPSHSLA